MQPQSTQRVLDAFEIGEQLYGKEILKRCGEGLSKIDKSNLRNAICKLYQYDMLSRVPDGRFYIYTLIRPKEDYAKQILASQNERKKAKQKEPKQLKPLEWYANMKVSKVLELSKQYKIPLPKTKEDIIKFHEMAAV